VPGPEKGALFACSASAIVEAGPIVKASVGSELFGPKLPEKVLLLRIRQKPPATVRDLGLSMVAVGCGAAALATRRVVANIVKKKCPDLFLAPMASCMPQSNQFGKVEKLSLSRYFDLELSKAAVFQVKHSQSYNNPYLQASGNMGNTVSRK
jgi:hypothetical protein